MHMDSPQIILNEPIEMKEETNSSLSEDRLQLRREILDNQLYPSIKEDIEKSIKNFNFWMYTAKVFLILKYMCLLSSPIVNFSSGYFSHELLLINFLSASLGSLGLGFDGFHKYSLTTAMENNKALDNILKSLNINYNKTSIYTDDNKNNVK
jgi:hypothetical protein